MAKDRAMNIPRAGVYVIKAAESRPARVEGNISVRPRVVPTEEDRRLAAALLKARRG